jgi:hypothetical protein
LLPSLRHPITVSAELTHPGPYSVAGQKYPHLNSGAGFSANLHNVVNLIRNPQDVLSNQLTQRDERDDSPRHSRHHERICQLARRVIGTRRMPALRRRQTRDARATSDARAFSSISLCKNRSKTWRINGRTAY